MEDVIFTLAAFAFCGLYVGASIAAARADKRFREHIVRLVNLSYGILSARLDFAKRRWRETEINAERWEDDGR